MRAVVDTNILISAVIKPLGTVGRVMHHLRQGDFTILYSTALLNELVDVLSRPRLSTKYGITPADIRTVVALILLRGKSVAPTVQITACRDPRDDKFLEVAVAGAADLLVSGDNDLLVLNPFEDIPIVTPRAFLTLLSDTDS